MERDEKGRYKKGESAHPSTRFTKENAREMQKRSILARKEHTTLRETVRAILREDGGSGMTKQEHLVRKAMENHRKGKLTFQDLKVLSSILGEDVLTVHTPDAMQVVVRNQEEADKINNIGSIEG